MIKISMALLEQIEFSKTRDPGYLRNVLIHLDPRIKREIQELLQAGHNGLAMFVLFYHYLDTGTNDPFDIETYWVEVRACNPEIAEWIVASAREGYSQFWVMVMLYRVFESAKQVSELEELFDEKSSN